MTKLNLYLDNKCNTNCSYCNVNYSKKRTLYDDDLIDWIVKNQEGIDFDYINLMGGEPSIIYENKIFDFITDCFKDIHMTSNMYDSDKINKWVSKVGDRLKITASVHQDIFDTQFQSFELFKDNIIKFNIVITEENIKDMYDIISKIDKFKKPINLIPRSLKIGEIYKGFEQASLKEQIEKIIDNDLHLNIINYEYVEKSRINKNTYLGEDCLCYDEISIDLNGDVFKCEYHSDFYSYNGTTILGNIYKNSLDEINRQRIEISKQYSKILDQCDSCRKCKSYGCYTRKKDIDNTCLFFCDFNKIFYDYIMNEYKFKFKFDKCVLLLTEKCNMRCSYCFEGDNKINGYGNMSNEIIKQKLDSFFDDYSNKNKVNKHIQLFGGEPTLNIEGMKYVYYYVKDLIENNKYSGHITMDINTNLYNFNEEVQDIFKKYICLVPFDISISIDVSKDIHDKNRLDEYGKPTYETIIKNYEILKNIIETLRNDGKAKLVRVCFHSVITSDNIDKLEEIVDETLKKIKEGYVCEATITLPTFNKTPEVFLNNYNIIEMVKKIDYYENKILDKYSKEDIDIINKFMSFYFFTNNLTNAIAHATWNSGLSVCGLVNKIIAFRSNGDPIPCHVFLTNTERDINNFVDMTQEEINYGISMNDKKFILYNLDRYLKSNLVDVYSEYENRKCNDCHLRFACHVCFASIKSLEGNKIIRHKENCIFMIERYKIFTEKMFLKVFQKNEELSYKNHILEGLVNNLLHGGIKNGNR